MRVLCRQLLHILLALATTCVAAQNDDASLAAAIVAYEAAAPAPLVARNAFMAQPVIPAAMLAPDGRHVAWLSLEDSVRSLHLLDTTTLESTRLFGSAKLRDIEWALDGKLILDLGDAIGGVTTTIESAAPAFFARLDSAHGDRLLGPSRASDGGILVVRKPRPQIDVLELVAYSGAATQLHTTDDKIENAFMSRDGNNVFIETTNARERHISVLRGVAVEVLLTCPVTAECRLVSYDATADSLWLMTSHTSDLLSLQTLTLASGKLQLVHRDPRAIVDIETVSTTGSRPALVRYHDGAARHYALDGADVPHLDRLGALLPGYNLALSTNEDGNVWLVAASASTLREPRWYLYDTNSMRLREILADSRNDALLPEAALSAKVPLHYSARDGEVVRGYVSLPKGVPLNGSALVALPHGGPWAHVLSDYSALTQFLVNRGYIVFEPNFRGSTDYGRAWMEAAHSQFGDGAVLHDVIDGVHYLLAQGIGDPERLGIVGGSFGGFQVLAGLAFAPDLFKVGVAAVPPADMGNSLRHLFRAPGVSYRDPALKATMRALIADVDAPAELDRLYATSPQAHLAAITAPLLIVAGADDASVDIAHVKNYTLQLANLGKKVTLFVDEDAGHALAAPRTQQALYSMIEKMLGIYLGGRSQPAEDPALAAYIQRKLLLNENDAFNID